METVDSREKKSLFNIQCLHLTPDRAKRCRFKHFWRCTAGTSAIPDLEGEGARDLTNAGTTA